MMNDNPIPGEVRMMGGKEYRFIECELEGDKWEAVASPIPPAPSDVAGSLAIVREIRDGIRANAAETERLVGPGCEVILGLMLERAEALDAALALIQSLSLDREVMREALEPFAKASAAVRYKRENDVLYGVTSSEPGRSFRLTWGDAHNARAALASVKGGA